MAILGLSFSDACDMSNYGAGKVSPLVKRDMPVNVGRMTTVFEVLGVKKGVNAFTGKQINYTLAMFKNVDAGDAFLKKHEEMGKRRSLSQVAA